MKIIIMQRNIVWSSPQENLRRTQAAMAHLEPCDLLVLPEMFATGFGASPQVVAEPAASGAVLTWMKQRARDLDAAVVGSVAVQDGESFRNRCYFVRPDGEVTFYDKHHLFALGGEDAFTVGQRRTIVEWRGVRFMLQVCYDLRFPLWNRNFEDYDCAIYVANWPTSRISQWTALLRARAIENQCYVVGVNRVGQDPVCSYNGASAVFHPFGHELSTCPLDEECTAAVELDMDALHHYRQKFPVLRERDGGRDIKI